MRNKLTIYIGTVIFMVLIVFIVVNKMDDLTIQPISVRVSDGGEMETINLWESEDGVYYVFLPSYAVAEQVKFHLNIQVPVYLDGMLLYDGMSCGDFLEGETHILHFEKWGKEVSQQITFLSSKNIATMYIDTQSGSMEYIHEQKGNSESANMRLYTSDGRLVYNDGLQSIKGRGNSTWEYHEKKPYTISLLQETSLLGMEKAKKWVLLANSFDSSALRNKIIYDFARSVYGSNYWSPECEYLDLYLNGEYLGLYLLCEKIDDSITEILDDGDYLYELQWKHKIEELDSTFEVTSKRAVEIQYPSNCNEQEKNELSRIVIEFQDSLYKNKEKPESNSKTWMEYIDLKSWVNKYLIEEVFANFDAGQASQFFWYDISIDKIYAGPCWDYDLTLGYFWGTTWTTPYCLLAQRDWEGSNSWYNALYQKEQFKYALTQCYIYEFRPRLQTLLESGIAVTAKNIEASAMLDHIRWKDEYCEKSWNDSVEELWNYLDERVKFLDNLWIDEAEYSVLTCHTTEIYNVCVLKGSTYTALPSVDSASQGKFLGWYYANSDEPFDSFKPITEDVHVYAKWEEVSSKLMKRIAELLPLAVIAVMGILLLLKDVYHNKRIR